MIARPLASALDRVRSKLHRRNFHQARKDYIARRMLQAYEDAITFRSERLDTPCPACAELDRCSVHAEDENLIGIYKQMHDATAEKLEQTALRVRSGTGG